jgi:hypothetical protein
MFKRNLLVVIGYVALLGGASIVSAQDKTPSVKYEAEAGLPKDKVGEKRRDYAVLEAALNDIASATNPENKNHIKNRGPGREIVISNETIAGDSGLIGIEYESHNIDGKDARRIPADMLEDFKRRRNGPTRSLKDFKPGNPNIIVRDLDKMFEEADFPLDAFLKEYPAAWGFVRAYPPGYSKDGRRAVVVFEGGPNGIHGLDWKYMLAKDKNRWIVLWRHCHPRE